MALIPPVVVNGPHLEALRTRAGLSQARLAEAAGLKHQSQIADLESGRVRSLRYEVAVNLAAMLGCAPTDLFMPAPLVVSGQSSVVSDVASTPAEALA